MSNSGGGDPLVPALLLAAVMGGVWYAHDQGWIGDKKQEEPKPPLTTTPAPNPAQNTAKAEARTRVEQKLKESAAGKKLGNAVAKKAFETAKAKVSGANLNAANYGTKLEEAGDAAIQAALKAYDMVPAGRGNNVKKMAAKIVAGLANRQLTNNFIRQAVDEVMKDMDNPGNGKPQESGKPGNGSQQEAGKLGNGNSQEEEIAAKLKERFNANTREREEKARQAKKLENARKEAKEMVEASKLRRARKEVERNANAIKEAAQLQINRLQEVNISNLNARIRKDKSIQELINQLSTDVKIADEGNRGVRKDNVIKKINKILGEKAIDKTLLKQLIDEDNYEKTIFNLYLYLIELYVLSTTGNVSTIEIPSTSSGFFSTALEKIVIYPVKSVGKFLQSIWQSTQYDYRTISTFTPNKFTFFGLTKHFLTDTFEVLGNMRREIFNNPMYIDIDHMSSIDNLVPKMQRGELKILDGIETGEKPFTEYELIKFLEDESKQEKHLRNFVSIRSSFVNGFTTKTFFLA